MKSSIRRSTWKTPLGPKRAARRRWPLFQRNLRHAVTADLRKTVKDRHATPNDLKASLLRTLGLPDPDRYKTHFIVERSGHNGLAVTCVYEPGEVALLIDNK